jgi:hypothetical protein
MAKMITWVTTGPATMKTVVTKVAHGMKAVTTADMAVRTMAAGQMQDDMMRDIMVRAIAVSKQCLHLKCGESPQWEEEHHMVAEEVMAGLAAVAVRDL